METTATHVCQFRETLVWSDWQAHGEAREREGRRVARCTICGLSRSRRTPRAAELVEREAHTTTPLIPDDRQDGRKVAAFFARPALRKWVAGRRPRFRANTVMTALGRGGWTASAAHVMLERLVRSGWLRAGYRRKGLERVLDYVEVRDPDRFYESVHPGERALRQHTLTEARRAVATADHPVARDIRDRLGEPDAQGFSALTVKALVAIAAHVGNGDVLSANVFSARYLGGAKELRRVRARLERLLGPLESLGVRDGGATLLVGGNGTWRMASAELRLSVLQPYVGLSRELVMQGTWEIPNDGLLVIENMAAFEAACAGDLRGVGEWMFVWSAGYPGRSVRRVVQQAVLANRCVWVWADLDLDGIRIARLIASWCGSNWEAWRMSADDVRSASVRRPIPSRARDAIRADLEAYPDAPLSDTLRAVIELDGTVEQEVFVGRRRQL